MDLEDVDIVIVGAGPAGLAVAGCLRRLGVDPVILERSDDVGSRWRSYYSRLRMNTSKRMSRLPGLKFERSDERWPTRAQVIAYLERMAATNELSLRFGVGLSRVKINGDRMTLETTRGSLSARVVVIATGQSERPEIPNWPGRESFPLPLLHVSEYTDASPYQGYDVLVVGAGDSASDVAVDLVEGGARRVRLAVRTPPYVIPRQLLGVPADVTAVVVSKFPPRMVDPIIGRVAGMAVGDLSRHGLPKPTRGLYAHHLYDRRAPIVDGGAFRRALKDGRIEVTPAVEHFDGHEVVLAGGERVTPEVVIAATGYTPGLEAVVGGLGVLGADGYPLHHAPDTNPAAPGLFFLGFRYPFAGNFRQIRLDAPRSARRIATYLANLESINRS